MRNRAKCKKCESIIESLGPGDEVSCKCGAISVYEGDKMACSATDWAYFLRVDDEGNVIVPTIQEQPKVTYDELLNALDEMINKIEAMPPHAMIVSINHYDFVSLLLLLSSLFRLKSDR